MGSLLIADLVEYLHLHDPNRLDRLQRRFTDPDEQELLDPDTTCAPPTKLLRTQMITAIAALDSFTEMWEKRAPSTKSRMKRANRWEFVGALLAALGSGGALLVASADEGARSFLIAFSSLGLMGAMMEIVTKFLRKDGYGGPEGLRQIHQALSTKFHKAKSLSLQLRPYIEQDDVGDKPEAVEELVADAVVLMSEVGPLIDALPEDA